MNKKFMYLLAGVLALLYVWSIIEGSSISIFEIIIALMIGFLLLKYHKLKDNK